MPATKLEVNANDLRFSAEGADAISDEVAVLVVTPDGTIDTVRESKIGDNQRPVLRIRTNFQGPGVVGNAKARILVGGKIYGAKTKHLDDADALFLTQSAIEKFVLPYYMRFKSA